LLQSLVGHGAEIIGYDYTLTRVGTEMDRVLLMKNLEDWLGEDAIDKPGVLELASTSPEIAYALLDAVEAEYGGFWEFCRKKMGFTDEDLEKVVKNIKKA
jgi:hypothetical protein